MQVNDLLLVYIHGFLGSIDSFQSFPKDLSDNLEINNSFSIYPTFDTKGCNTRAVHALVDWLLIHATTFKAKNVILIGHSMGGILAVDAFNYLQDLDCKNLIHIIGILTVDSPFYGLSNHTSKSSITNLKEAITQIQPQDLIPESIHVPISKEISVPISTSWISSAYAKYAIAGTAAVASVMSFSSFGIGGLMYLGKKADQVSEHLRFLFPLACSKKEMHSRVLGIIQKHELKSVFFHGFYLEIQDQDQKRHFCSLPLDFPESRQYFTPISSNLKDEIQGHMYIFSNRNNSDEYTNLLKITRVYIQETLNHLNSKALKCC